MSDIPESEQNTLIMRSTDELDAAAPEPRTLPETAYLGDIRTSSVMDLLEYPRSDGYPTGNFTLIPTSLAAKALEHGIPRWWLEIWLDDAGLQRLRFEIVGDVVIGRSSEVDIDLQDYHALDKGVSRQHAMLRPSRKALYLIDLGSTNGTQYNGIPMGKGAAVPLTENCVIRLGTLNLTIHFLALTIT